MKSEKNKKQKQKNTPEMLTCFVLEMTADSNNLWDFLQYMGLIRVAWEKLNVFENS